MKKLLVILLSSLLVAPAFAADKKPADKPAVVKKEVKKHKKFEGEKVPEKAPAPAKKK
jgi:uncharacterized protein YdeI (BOF family)